MPMYQYEAMDQTGQEIKDVIEAANQEEAQATIRQAGYFITKISVKKSRKTGPAKQGTRKGKSFAIGGVGSKVLTAFTRQLSILQDAGLPLLRSLKILEDAVPAGALKNTPHRRLRGDRRRGHPLRGHGQEPQGLQPPLRQHDQGRRGGRCAGSDPPPPGRVPGTVPILETQGQGRAGLPGGGGHFRHRHPVLHHVLDRAEVRDHVQELQRRSAHDDLRPDRHLELHGRLLVPLAGHSAGHLADHEIDPQVPRRPHGLGLVHHQDAHLRPA